VNFNWTPRTLNEWKVFFKQTTQANWMQSWSYATAKLKYDHTGSRLALIEKNNKPIGLVCIQENKLGFIHLIDIKRGPLWFETPTTKTLIEFANLLSKEFPKRIGRRLTWLPEFDFSKSKEEKIFELLKQKGFNLQTHTFITSIIDLSSSEDEIKKNFDQKWRNCLNKSFRENIEVKINTNLKNPSVFFQYYNRHLTDKKYKGPTARFLMQEFSELEKINEIFYLWAIKNSNPVSAIVITINGNTASYRVGWNTEVGRKSNAHYLLIWNAIIHSKKLGLTKFDLGGLLPVEAPGVTSFKEKMNGQKIHLLGFKY